MVIDMRENYILSGLMGMCVGDALGVPVEFMHREEIKQNLVSDMRGFGTHNQPAGTWSDDSSMAFCLAESLCEGYDLHDIANKFCKWYFNGYWTPHGDVFDVGNTTRMAIGQLAKGVEPVMAGGDSEENCSNGSLMRILPAAFYTHKMPIKSTLQVVEEISSLTHRHKMCIIACSAYVFLAREIIDGKEKGEAFKSLQDNLPELFGSKEEYLNELKHFKRLLNKDFGSLPINQIKSSGYVIDSLEAAVWCFLNRNDYSETVLEAVNLGGDTDTIGSLAGGLAGLCYGFDGIPRQWVDQIAKKAEIFDLAEKLKSALK